MKVLGAKGSTESSASLKRIWTRKFGGSKRVAGAVAGSYEDIRGGRHVYKSAAYLVARSIYHDMASVLPG